MKKVLFLVLCTLVLAVSCKGKSSEKTSESAEISVTEKTVRKLPEFSFFDFEQYGDSSVLSTLKPSANLFGKGTVIFSEYVGDRLNRKLIYINQRLTCYESYLYESTTTEFLYDDQNRITGSRDYYIGENGRELIEDSGCEYRYSESAEGNLQQDLYRHGELVHSTEKIILDDCYLFRTVSGNSKTEYKVFFDDSDRVYKVEETRFYENKKTDTSSFFEYIYDQNNRLIQVLRSGMNNYGITKESKIPWKIYGFTYEYDENGNLQKEVYSHYDKTSGEETQESYDIYSDYDVKGYWQKYEHYYKGELKEVRIRKIEG